MKQMIKKIIGVVFLTVSIMSFVACEKGSKSSKFKVNANNGFSIYEDNMYWIKDGNVSSLDLQFGEPTYDEYELPSNIDKNSIIGFSSDFLQYGDGNILVKKENEISFIDYETNTLSSDIKTLILPDSNYIALLPIDRSSYFEEFTDIAVVSKDKISVYYFLHVGDDWTCKEFSLEKQYESAFYLGGRTIGLINGKEIDFIQVEIPDSFQKASRVFTVKNHIVLDKVYDAYVGCYIDYDYMSFDEKTLYLGCIEGNKIKFFDIKKGQFAVIPLEGTEMAWTF